MIIYSMTINKGGLRRVTESMFKIFDYLQNDIEFKIMYFSDSKIEGLDPEKFIFQKLEEGNPDLLTDEGMKFISSQIAEKLKPFNVKRIIFESSVYRYWKDFPAKISLDIHILERPLHQALTKNPEAVLIDDVSPDPFYKLLVQMSLVSMKLESIAFNKADHIISNSITTNNDLSKYYTKEVQSKRIDYIPVTTTAKNNSKNFITSDYSINPKFYYFGRFHPQKGLHFLFKEDWNWGKLTIKGFDAKLIKTEKCTNLLKKNIHFLPWSNEQDDLISELAQFDFILFPSIYEPYGLALTEALMLGKICICHDNQSGHNEQVEHMRNGFIIDMKKSDWIDRIKEITQIDRDVLETISMNAKNEVRHTNEFRLSQFAKMIKDLHHDLN